MGCDAPRGCAIMNCESVKIHFEARGAGFLWGLVKQERQRLMPEQLAQPHDSNKYHTHILTNTTI